MDIDSVLASIGFTFSAWRKECTNCKLCFHCLQPFDRDHIKSCGCVLPEDEWLQKDDILKFWKKWGGALQEDNRREESPFKPRPIDKGKKRESISEVVNEQPIKRRSVLGPSGLSNPPPATTSAMRADNIDAVVDSIDLEPMTLSEILFAQGISQLEDEDCKSSLMVKSCLLNERPFFEGRLRLRGGELLPFQVLVDSGSSSSFIDEQFVRRHELTTFSLSSPLRVESFDGLSAASGDVTEGVDIEFFIPLSTGSFLRSTVQFFVTRLSSADAILGSSWLKASNTFIGGVNNSIIINGCILFNSSISVSPGNYLLKKFADVFVTDSLASLPPHRKGFDCEVNLKEGSTPSFGRMYNLSKPETDALRKYINENVAKGFICLSSSPAAAPIFYVKVEGKADRPCVDYRLLNGMTVRDSYPLPVIGQLLNNLHGCKFLSKVDLKAAFNLLRVAPGHEWKTSFRTPWGLYEYQVMPFGLATAPATFQRFIQHVLREYLDVCCFVYIDNILIFSKTEEAHVQDLEKVLSKLREYSLKALLGKCEFFSSKVTFLGFDITAEGLKMNERKLITISDWPYLSGLKEL
jgi:hypothetical protein